MSDIERSSAPQQKPPNNSSDRPLRVLALQDWGVIEALSLSEFDEIRGRFIYEGIESCETLTGQTIVRACALLFSLVESGGLTTSSPHMDIERLRIDIHAVMQGYVRWPARKAKGVRGETEVTGPRQHMYILGRVHLLAFVLFRIKHYNVQDDSPLLPPLPPTAAKLKKELNGEVGWLNALKGKVSWGRIFQTWLNHRLSEVRGYCTTCSWSNLVELALWRLLQHDQYPIITAVRRGRIGYAPMPDEEVNGIVFYIPFRRKDSNETEGYETDSGIGEISDGEILPEVIDNSEGVITDYYVPDEVNNIFQLNEAFDYIKVHRFLATLCAGGLSRREAVRQAKSFAISNELTCKPENELCYLLEWMGELLSKGRTYSTVYTYASRVLRLLYALSPDSFSDCTTEDIAHYLDNYEGVNTVKVIRNTAKQFYEYLKYRGLVRTVGINWSSKTLLALEQYRERAIITEQDYQQVRSVANASINPEARLRHRVLLTLLRRCGLRSVEASWLRPIDFLGITECRLRVPRSKTRAGRGRMFPLYLLLSPDELEELLAFVKRRQMQTGETGYLFVDSDGQRCQASVLAREVERLLRKGGVIGDTAHGLRHAFASALFASLWLNITGEQDRPKGRQAQRALEEFCRAGIESRAITHPYHIQLLLGHANIQITYERYIHLLDMATADVTRIAERDCTDRDLITKSVMAQLLDIDIKMLPKLRNFPQQFSDGVFLTEVERLLRNRIGRFV